MTKGGNKNYKVPKSGLKYRPINGSPGSKKALVSPYGTIQTPNNLMRMMKSKY